MVNSSVEIRFDPDIIPKGIGDPVYKTTIIRSDFDFEKRNIARAEWLYEGDIGEVLLDERQTAYEIAFFNARRGKAEGFRYRYWGDYTCTALPLELSPTTFTAGVVRPVGNSESVFQLQKKYVDAGDASYKTITKPVEGTVEVYINGELSTAGHTIDYSQGYIYFSSPPAGAIA